MFSWSGVYERPKMYSDGGGGNGACVVHSLHSMIGVGKQIWVLGLLS